MKKISSNLFRIIPIFLLIIAICISIIPFNVSADRLDDEYYYFSVNWDDYLTSLHFNDDDLQFYGKSFYDVDSAYWRLYYHDDPTEYVSVGNAHYFNTDLSEDAYFIDSFALVPFGRNLLDLSLLSDRYSFYVDLVFDAEYSMVLSYHVEVNYFDSNLQFMRNDIFPGDSVSIYTGEYFTSELLEFSFDGSFNYAEIRIVFESDLDATFTVSLSRVYSDIYLTKNFHNKICGTEFFYQLEDIVRSVYQKQESNGQLDSEHIGLYGMAILHFFSEVPLMPPPTEPPEPTINITFDPNDISSYFDQMDSLLEEHTSALLAVSLLFELFFTLPILSPLLYLSLSFGICMCALSIIPSVSSFERRRSIRKTFKNRAKSGAKSGGKSGGKKVK